MGNHFFAICYIESSSNEQLELLALLKNFVCNYIFSNVIYSPVYLGKPHSGMNC
jgi:hypothetical protein